MTAGTTNGSAAGHRLRRGRFGPSALGALLVSLCASAASRADATPPRLEPGKPIERPTKGGVTDLLEFVLPANGFARLRVDQRKTGVRVGVRGPGGKEVDWTDETGSYGSEFIALLGLPAGVYQLDVTNLGPPDYQGPVLVTLVEAREGRPGDQVLIDADLKFREANRFRRKQDAASLRKAIALFTEAIALYAAAGDWWRGAESTNRRGLQHLALGDYGPAAIDFEVARNVFRAKGPLNLEAAAELNGGKVLLAQGELAAAQQLFEQSLADHHQAGDLTGEAYAMSSLAASWERLGESAKAIELLEQTIPIFKEHYDQLGRIESWNSLARLLARTGEFQKALENYDRVLEQAAGMTRNPQAVGASLAMQGKARVYLALGDLESAQSWCDQGQVLARTLQSHELLASSLELSGELLLRGGDPRRAIATLEESLAACRVTGSRGGEARLHGRIGSSLAELGDHPGALARFELALQVGTEIGDKQTVAETLLLQSAELELLGRFDEAARAAEAALPLSRGVDDRLGEANGLHRLARAQRGAGKTAAALQSIGAAVELFESLRILIDSPELRTRWRATTQGAFELWIELLMEQHQRAPEEGFDEKALLANERSLARGLIETLGASREGLRQDGPPALLKLRRELSRKANALEFRRVLSQTNRAVHPPDPDELKEVLDAARELDGRLLAASPRWAAVTATQSLRLAEVQRELDEETLLLELSLGERRSYLWLVSSKGLRSVVLPPRAGIEDQARALYAALTARNAAAADASVAARRARLARADAEVSTTAAALSRTLLSPVAGELGRRRLVLVTDGALRLIPFAALPEPGGRQPLAAGHEIVSLPSAALLQEVRRGAPLRPAASGRIAVIADPVYEAADARVKGRPGPPLLTSLTATRAGRDLGLLGFSRLRHSREEADGIAALARGAALSLVDFAATREAAASVSIEEARVVHFATHSLMNTVHPELSGLVLSLVDEQGRPQDGFLRLHEIYNLQLRAGLVVLSACQTAVGKEFKGEGLVALTRGFLAAGAPRVVASLWSVDDRATAELMKRFYQALLVRKLTAAAALRAAQQGLAKDPRWKAAYYWAGFGLHGDWR